MNLPEEYRRHLRSGGVAIWAVVGAPVLVTGLQSPTANGGWRALAAWVAALLFFGATFRGATRARGESNRAASLAMIAGQTIAALLLLALPPCFGLEAALLVLVALELGAFLSRRAAVAWIAAQSAAFAAITWAQWGWHWAVVLAFAYSSFQLIADATTRLFIESAAARARLIELNAELEATRELLAQSTRNDERARIARDLHDVLGHHLTALSLNLEIASHLTQGDAMARVETAQSVTRLLLGDVRAVVGELRQSASLDIAAALAKLAAGIPRPRIHIEVAAGVVIDDPVAGEVVLRCAQEIVTNTVRHAQAENLWLGVTQSESGIEIHARDDGRGAGAVRAGGGLSGMRDRFEKRGGAFSVETAPGRGFSLKAILPLAGGAS